MPYDIFCDVRDITTGAGKDKKVFFQGFSPHLGNVSVFFGVYKKLKRDGSPHPKAGQKYCLVSLAKGRRLLKDRKSIIKTELNDTI